jgi:DNA-binding FadR family transcriptional regulator
MTPVPPLADGSRPKAAVIVANKLRRRIVTGEIAVGGSLPPENRLIEELEVSRPSLRAALRILESEQLITVRRGSRGGAWVNAPTAEALAERAGVYMQYHQTTLDELYRAQAVVEPPAVRILAERRDPTDVAHLRTLLAEEAVAVTDRVAFRAAALRFHRALVELSRAKLLVVFSSIVHGVIEAHAERQNVSSQGTYRAGVERHAEHERVVDLIGAGDADGAARLWAEHLEAAHRGRSDNGEPLRLLELT